MGTGRRVRPGRQAGLKNRLLRPAVGWLASGVALALAVPLNAQTVAAPVVLGMPGSSRALALGNAYPLASAESDAVFYNPALLGGARGIAGSVSLYGSGARLYTVSGGLAWWDGGVGFGVQALSYSGASLTEGTFGRGESGLSDSGAIGASEQIISAAYARTLFGFAAGLAGKLIDYRVNAEHAATVALDVGIVRRFGPVALGLAGRNIGRDPSVSALDAELPTEVTLGAASTTRAAGPLDLMLAASAGWRRDDTASAGGGIEVSYWPVQGRTFTGRAGVRWIEDSDMAPLTLGAGFTGDRIALDWAFEDIETGKALHRFTIRLR